MCCCSWVTHRNDFQWSGKSTSSRLYFIGDLADWHDISFCWPVLWLEMWYVYTEKNTCILPKALSAHIHSRMFITLLTELTFRGHFSIPGCWMDTFQPGLVVHLCYTAVGIKQHQGCRVFILVISIYLTYELDRSPLLTSCTPITIQWLYSDCGWLRPINTGFKGLDMWIQCQRRPYWWSRLLSESSERGLVGGAARGDLEGGCRKWENWCVPRSILESIRISTV